MHKEIFKRGAVGIAAELRVMSELLLRGFNVAKSYLDYGIDLYLENGYKIQVKAGREHKGSRGWERYYMYFNPFKKNQVGETADFVICWCVNVNVFYVMPVKLIKNKRAILFSKTGDNSTYKDYKEAWHLLKRRIK